MSLARKVKRRQAASMPKPKLKQQMKALMKDPFQDPEFLQRLDVALQERQVGILADSRTSPEDLAVMLARMQRDRDIGVMALAGAESKEDALVAEVKAMEDQILQLLKTHQLPKTTIK